ncbi:hypothetical protein [uncultured Polaribacter sp.]|uniref:hypothetical protein n=1 Tax=uncultured Polaribacter sp. TaxID=174711 RepID=UPI002616A176|nr:hypothetical protein [uncultured Polaribacter sp.]
MLQPQTGSYCSVQRASGSMSVSSIQFSDEVCDLDVQLFSSSRHAITDRQMISKKSIDFNCLIIARVFYTTIFMK